MRGLYDGSVLSDVEFTLYDYGDDGEVIEVLYLGAYGIVDNGCVSSLVVVFIGYNHLPWQVLAVAYGHPPNQMAGDVRGVAVEQVGRVDEEGRRVHFW
jgi:hypothetical protein